MILLASSLTLSFGIGTAQSSLPLKPAIGNAVGDLEGPSFAAVSVRPSSSKENGYRLRTSSGRLTAVGITATELLEFAYDLKPFQVRGGPGWSRVDRFDITAVMDESISLLESKEAPLKRSGHIRSVTQHLLSERFGLVVHKETLEGSVYELTLAKPMTNTNHLGLRPFVEGTPALASTYSPGDYNRTMTGIPISALAATLSDYLRSPVIDKTNLQGAFDVNLSWHDALSDDGSSATATGSLPEALRTELDMLLLRAKGPVEMLVIDNLDRPSAN